MKLFFIISGLLTQIGGIERVGSRLATELSARGHDVSIITRAAFGKKPFFPLHKNIRVIPCCLEQTPETIAKLRRMILQERPDVCVSMYSWNEVELWPHVLRDTGIPYVYSEHSSPEVIERERWNRPARLAVLSAADGIHILLPSYINSIPDSLRNRVEIIANPVSPSSTPARAAPSPCRRHLLLSVGRLINDIKQFDILIQAFAQIACKFPQWELHICGEGPDMQYLQKLAVDSEAGEHIRFLGATAAIGDHYEEAEIFCLPSRFEGFPMALAEALAHGLPCVGFAECTGVNNLIDHGYNGLLAHTMAAPSLSDTLSTLMSNPELRHTMGKNARRKARNWDSKMICSHWEKFLKNITMTQRKTALQQIEEESNMALFQAVEMLERENIFLPNTQISNYAYLLNFFHDSLVEQLRFRDNQLKADVQALYASKSWLATAWLRKIFSLV